MTENERSEVKMYSDFKSPYAFLAFDPAFVLEDKYRIRLKWKPFQLRLKGKGQRSIPGMAAKFSRWEYTKEVVADRLGEHNEEVLRDLLSLTHEEIDRLYADKTIVRDPFLDAPVNDKSDQLDES